MRNTELQENNIKTARGLALGEHPALGELRITVSRGGGGGGHSPLNWVGGCRWGVQNLTLFQNARRTNIHPVTIYLTKKFICITLLQYCTPRIYPVLLLFYSKKKWKTRNLLRPARTVAGAEIAGLS